MDSEQHSGHKDRPRVKTDSSHPESALPEQFRAYFGSAPDSIDGSVWSDGRLVQMFQSIEMLRTERYVASGWTAPLARQVYYWLRPLLTRHFRQFIHRQIFRSRVKSNVPGWPIDCSVDHLFRAVMGLVIEISGEEEVPFIWFWPEGHPAAVMMTHDVEGSIGAAGCKMLMDLDDSFRIPAAFQLIPEGPYDPIAELVNEIRGRGHEVNLHDLDHDGRLYGNAARFAERAKKIRHYAEVYGTRGFRAGSMHRNQDWLPELQVEYDMSVPTVAHMEPQGGGCCSVMPYFIGNVLELPLTTIQDYGLFSILKQSSIELWSKQIEAILKQNGLISFIVHPDYVIETPQQETYSELLDYLAQQINAHGLWAARPGDINEWWRQRRCMQLVRTASGWAIEGEGSDRARIAYASMSGGEVSYRWDKSTVEARRCDELLV